MEKKGQKKEGRTQHRVIQLPHDPQMSCNNEHMCKCTHPCMIQSTYVYTVHTVYCTYMECTMCTRVHVHVHTQHTPNVDRC